MLKKFLAGVFLLMIISVQASAMRLELYPQPIGKIFFDGENFQIDGATKIKGNSKKGVALFGDKFYPRTEADRKRYGTSAINYTGINFIFTSTPRKKLVPSATRAKKILSTSIRTARQKFLS